MDINRIIMNGTVCRIEDPVLRKKGTGFSELVCEVPLAVYESYGIFMKGNGTSEQKITVGSTVKINDYPENSFYVDAPGDRVPANRIIVSQISKEYKNGNYGVGLRDYVSG